MLELQKNDKDNTNINTNNHSNNKSQIHSKKALISETPQHLGFLPKWNLYTNPLKLAAVLILAAAAGALFFLLRTTASGDDFSPAFFCFNFNSRPKKTLTLIQTPKIDFDSIKPNSDKSSPYSSFTSDHWIVVSVSDHPSDALRKLTRIKGWQVLAVGNSRTPKDWSLKGAIFLSLEDQASLNFRVLDYLPYESHVRKSAGYLFAVQHGAKAIFDADDRAEAIDSDFGKHFDLKLDNVDVLQERILMYSVRKNPNRTVVNPYVHFGQRSVWPRGLPLENVGEIWHEENYDEVFGGAQYIQQGLSNGLPDVDSFFYFTRKSGSETFDIRFDNHAPKVGVPRGLMVPVNSFNTLFHVNAFWGLMLPVSVSSMASDVIRGYWAQRILWEIGGSVVVYPPTIYREDKVGGFAFVEEKDLHVNSGRLIKFLVSWRSGKRKLFDKIVDLSFAMAREGFWTERDARFSVAWLEDLVSVGYVQSKLKAVELSNTKREDSKEYVPRKLPSVHLGVEESETVNYEIGNLVRWRKSFGNIVLIMFVSGGSVEGTALEWRLLYGRVFKAVVILSEKPDPDLAIEQASLDELYKYLPKIFDRFTSTEGFIFLQDNTILNYWNLHLADKSKLWITNKVPKSWTTVAINDNNKDSVWLSKQANMVKKVVSTMAVHFQVSYKSSLISSDHTLTMCSSEVFYVPRQFVGDFVDLVGLVGNFKMHHKVALPMFFTAMDLPEQFDSIFSRMIYKPEALSGNSSSFYSAQAPAIYPWMVSNEAEFVELIRLMEAGDPLLMELV